MALINRGAARAGPPCPLIKQSRITHSLLFWNQFLMIPACSRRFPIRFVVVPDSPRWFFLWFPLLPAGLASVPRGSSLFALVRAGSKSGSLRVATLTAGCPLVPVGTR